MGRHLRRRAGIGPEAASDAKLNIVWGNNATVANLHLVRYVRQAMRKGGRWWLSIHCARRSPSRPICILRDLPGTDVVLGLALATELERMGAFDDTFIAANVLGFDEFMARAREWPAARAAAACGVPESRY